MILKKENKVKASSESNPRGMCITVKGRKEDKSFEGIIKGRPVMLQRIEPIVED